MLGLCKGHKKTRGPRSRHPCLDSKKCSESCENRCFEGYDIVTLALKFSRRSVFMNSKNSSGFLAIRRWGKRFYPGRDPNDFKSLKILEVCLSVDFRILQVAAEMKFSLSLVCIIFFNFQRDTFF